MMSAGGRQMDLQFVQRVNAFSSSVGAPNGYVAHEPFSKEHRVTQTFSEYTPADVWEWNTENGGQFANINRPIAGATH
jgi:hypothetical protein